MTDPAPAESQYTILPREGPYPAAIGSALITMVEPHEGHDVAYNRWYEDDHFYSGAMAMPWMFAGRRWVAPRELQALRYPADSAIAQPVSAGKYISLYWITEGRYEDHLRWTVATNQRLLPDGRVYLDRTHVYTSFQTYERRRLPRRDRPARHRTASTTRTRASWSRWSTRPRATTATTLDAVAAQRAAAAPGSPGRRSR